MYPSHINGLGAELSPGKSSTYSDLRARYTQALQQYRALEQKYPNTRGACALPQIESSDVLSFSAVQGADAPASQSASVRKSPRYTGEVSPSLSSITYEGAKKDWLTVRLGGMGLSIRPNTTNLPPGTYKASIVVSPLANRNYCDAAGARALCALISVTYTVTAPVDKTPEQCVELRKQRDELMALIDANCALLAADPAAKKALYDLLNSVNADLRTFCSTKAGWSDVKTLAGLGYSRQAAETVYANLRARYAQADAALRSAQAANPALVGRSCAYQPPPSISPIITPPTQSPAFPADDSQTMVREEDKRILPEGDVGFKFPWWLILLGVAGYYYSTKKP